MSLSSALNSAVDGLKAQSAALSVISDNISNASTTAYKTKNTNFQEILTGSGKNSGGSVTYSISTNVTKQGTISTTDVATNVAINGNGFFVVSDNLTNKPSAYQYSRNGNFNTDSQGYLVNDEGYYLLGQVTDTTGKVTATNKNDLNSLVPINVNTVQGAAKATSKVTESINLPADATTGTSYTTAAEVFDSLGISSTVTQTWTKTGTNTWSLALSNPTLTSDSTVSTGTISPSSFSVTFNSDGSFGSVTPATDTVGITWTTGAANSTVNFYIGTANGSDGLTQYSSTSTKTDITINSITGDGLRYGKLSSISIDDSGLVEASFDNGLKIPVYQIPVATFPDENDLTHVKGSIYDESSAAGNYSLQLPGESNAGSIQASALESSTTDTSEEFNKMIVAQQSYSAAAQIVSTVKTMYDALLTAVR